MIRFWKLYDITADAYKDKSREIFGCCLRSAEHFSRGQVIENIRVCGICQGFHSNGFSGQIVIIAQKNSMGGKRKKTAGTKDTSYEKFF